jgi:hypothetical protein
MLTDVLGIIIGFVTIVLLLSILVTAAVQTAVSAMKSRHKALGLGIESSSIVSTLDAVLSGFLVEVDSDKQALAAFRKAIADTKSAASTQDIVAAVVKATASLPDTSSVKKLCNQLVEVAGGTQSAADVSKLFQATAATLDEPADATKAQAPKKLAEAITAGSTDARLKQLPELVDQGITKVKSGSDVKILLDLVKNSVANCTRDKRVTWIEDKEVIEPLKTAGVSAAGVEAVRHALDHTRMMMDTHFLRWARVLTFASAIAVAFLFQASVPDVLTRLQSDAALRAEADKQATKQVSEQQDQDREEVMADLARLGIKPMQDLSFYWGSGGTVTGPRWGNIFGVLFMAVLLSFGAPFWYRMLKELVGLKDALRKKDDKVETGGGEKPGKEAKT